MSMEVISQKLSSYQCQTILDQENALKEIAQEIALMALSRKDFFKKAAFQGGTCLRILYGLERFSEDLDFILEKPDQHFSWEEYIENMKEEFELYGYKLEVLNRNKLDKVVRTAFLKAESLGGILVLKDLRTNCPKLQIKLEIDTNPPEGSNYELKYLDFPMPFAVKTQDLPSLFSGKIHALLCRPYTKGRDWYDFSWYVSRSVAINLSFLNHALQQNSLWENANIDKAWLFEKLRDKIMDTNWSEAKKDIMRFLRPRELPVLDLWGQDFFLSRLDKLKIEVLK